MNALAPQLEPEQEEEVYRTPPQNLEVEQALLGCVLVNNTNYHKVAGFLRPEHFYEGVHGEIFAACGKLIEKNKKADPKLLRPFFEASEGLKDVGGGAYLVRLAASAASIINATDYAKVIYDLALRRELIAVGEDMVRDAYDADVDAEPMEQIAEAEGQLYAIAERGDIGEGALRFSQSVTETMQMINHNRMAGQELVGVPTGLKDLDSKTGGLKPGNLIILAARPAMGKSALAQFIAWRAAKARLDSLRNGDAEVKGTPVAFYTLEMTNVEVVPRILAMETGIDSFRIERSKSLSADEMKVLKQASEDMEEAPLFIDDAATLTIAQLRSSARRLKRQHGIGLIVVDYLQLMTASRQSRHGTREQDVSEISRGLKALAKELNIPVIALSQLNRSLEVRDNKRPLLFDIRESGSVEQDANVVMFLYRDIEYLEKEEPKEGTPEWSDWRMECEEKKNALEIIIAKNRAGPKGTVHAHYIRETSRFSDPVKQEDMMPERFGGEG